MRPAVNSLGRRLDPSRIAETAAVIIRRIAIEDFPPPAAAGSAGAVIHARHGSEVAGDEHDVAVRLSFAQEAQRAAFGVVAVDPLEAGGIAVELVERRLAAVGAV